MKKTILLVSLALVSWGAFAQHNHSHDEDAVRKNSTEAMAPMFKDKNLGIAYEKYINLKNALVASDVMKAKNISAELLYSLQEVKKSEKAYSASKSLAKAVTLEDHRREFSILSKEMAVLVKSNKLSMGAVYLEFCPMANDNKGGYWLSNESVIENPYFGDKMLKCGSVKETIN